MLNVQSDACIVYWGDIDVLIFIYDIMYDKIVLSLNNWLVSSAADTSDNFQRDRTTL